MTREQAKQQHKDWDFSNKLEAYSYFEEEGKRFKVTIKNAWLRLCPTKEATLEYLSKCVDEAVEV